MILNRRADRTVAPFYGSAVLAKKKICKVKARSPLDLDRDSIHRRIAKQLSKATKDEFIDAVAARRRRTDTRSAPRLYPGSVARIWRRVRSRLRDRVRCRRGS